MLSVPPKLIARLRLIRLLVLDVDGILTDGKIIYDSTGAETKAFCVSDGIGITALIKAGIKVAIITGRDSPMVKRRADELGIAHLIQGRDDKLTALKELAERLNLSLSDCLYMGDDLPDVSAIKAAKVGVSVPNGCLQAQKFADYTTKRFGGDGAVREISELILMAQDKFTDLLKHYDAL